MGKHNKAGGTEEEEKTYVTSVEMDDVKKSIEALKTQDNNNL